MLGKKKSLFQLFTNTTFLILLPDTFFWWGEVLGIKLRISHLLGEHSTTCAKSTLAKSFQILSSMFPRLLSLTFCLVLSSPQQHLPCAFSTRGLATLFRQSAHVKTQGLWGMHYTCAHLSRLQSRLRKTRPPGVLAQAIGWIIVPGLWVLPALPSLLQLCQLPFLLFRLRAGVQGCCLRVARSTNLEACCCRSNTNQPFQLTGHFLVLT